MLKEKKVIFVVGPTGVGKSRRALELAQKYGGSIVNADSIQFYQGLLIGSAAPTAEDFKKAPHYLYSYVSAPQEMTAGQFLRDFYQLLDTQKDLQFPLIVVGGTGFYIQALEKGMYNVPAVDPELKEQIENEIKTYGSEKAYQELIEFDPETKIHVNDAYRIGRALEVKRAFNLKMSELKMQAESETKHKLPFPFIKIGVDLDKEVLRSNIRKRTESMLAAGLIDEVKTFMDCGYAEWAPLSSVGYLEVKHYLQGKLPYKDLAEAINQSTNQLIKKQRTWFKRDNDIQWNVKDISSLSFHKHSLSS